MASQDQNRGRLVPAFLIAALAASCGISKSASIADAGNGGADLPPATTSDGGSLQCRGPIDGGGPFGGCARQFEDEGWKKDFCHYPVVETVCAGYRARSFNLYTHSWTCYYDPTTLTLVGGEFRDDIPTFCNRSSYETTLGTVPEAGTCSPASSVCGTDGGTDGGG